MNLDWPDPRADRRFLRKTGQPAWNWPTWQRRWKLRRPPKRPPAAAEPARPRNETMAVKVDTAKLDYLVDMAGEMVIAESLVRHDPELSSVKSQALQRKLAQMTRITAELQKTAMAMRWSPSDRCSAACRAWCATSRGNSASRCKWRPRATRSNSTAPSSKNWPIR
jgi:hypothetical protein